MNFRFTSLQTALVARFVTAAAVPLLVFGWLLSIYLHTKKTDEISLDLEVHAQNIRNEIEEFAEELQYELRIVHDTVSLLEDRPDDTGRFLQSLVAGADYFEAVYLLDDSLRIRALGLSPEFGSVRSEYIGLDFSGMAFLKEAHHKAATGFLWSDILPSPLSGKPVVMLVTGSGRNTVLGAISIDRLNPILQQRIRQSETMAFAVVDHHGTLIAHSDERLAMQRINLLKIYPEIQSALSSDSDVPIKRHEDLTLLESALLVPNTGWVVHASIPQTTIDVQTTALRRSLFTAVIVAAGLGAFLAYWMARRIGRHLVAIGKGAKALAEDGTIEFESVKGSYVEIDELMQHLQDMAAAVLERETFLTASEERYHSVVTNLGEGLLIVNAQGLVIDCNPSAERILHRSRARLLGQTYGGNFGEVFREDGSRILPEDYPITIPLQHGEVVENRLIKFVRHDGLELWLQINSRPLRSEDGKNVAAVVTFTDVTGLKLIEDSLRCGKERFEELYQQFQALLEGISDRISLIGPEMEVSWSNHDSGIGCFAETSTYQGWCCYQQYFGRSEPCPGCPVVRCFADGIKVSSEKIDEHGRIWSLRAFPVYSAQFDHGVRQVVLMAEDITEKRSGEQQRLRANQLAALGELAAGVAHEINNPISGVINYAQLIANYTPGESRENDLARRIIKEGDRIATIVRELLVFARNETQQVQKISVREAFGEALILCEASLRKEQVLLRIDLPADLPKVESRSHQLQQLFLNLLVNARHALTEKYPGADDDKQLLVSGEAVEIGDRPCVRIKVRDHGSGIPPELLGKVMNPFFTTKPAGVGTGLGLSISFEIAKRHGGSLSLSSEYGEWTEAVVDLPAVID